MDTKAIAKATTAVNRSWQKVQVGMRDIKKLRAKEYRHNHSIGGLGGNMPKITLKEVQEKYAKLLSEARAYATAVRNPKVCRHLTAPVTITNSEGQPTGRVRLIAVEELVATAKAGELLGFETRIAAFDGGKSIELVFVQKTTDVPVPDSIVYGG